MERPPATLSRDQVGRWWTPVRTVRDRFIVEALYATGLRVAELCGLRLADLHLVPSAAHLGCKVAGAHLHVVRREDNENGALAKSVWPRVVPVTKALVWLHDAYRFERDAVAGGGGERLPAGELVAGSRSGRAMTPDAVERLFVRLSAKVGLQGPPAHAAPQLRLRGGAGDQGSGVGEGAVGACLGRLDRRLPACPLG